MDQKQMNGKEAKCMLSIFWKINKIIWNQRPLRTWLEILKTFFFG